MTQQKTTNPDSQGGGELTPQQAAAVDLLAIGNTVTQVSESIGVTRQTVSECLNRHGNFKAVSAAIDGDASRVAE